MKRRIMQTAAVVAMSLGMVAAPAVAQKGPLAGERTLTGVISDSMCGATHMAKDKSAAECTRTCVQQGQKYALVVGKDVYTLQGHEPELDKLAGQRVNIQGKLTGETLTVSSVTPAKKKSKSKS